MFLPGVFLDTQRCSPVLDTQEQRYKCYTDNLGCSLLSPLSLFPQVWKIHGTIIGSVECPPFEIGSQRIYYKGEPFAMEVVNAAPRKCCSMSTRQVFDITQRSYPISCSINCYMGLEV